MYPNYSRIIIDWCKTLNNAQQDQDEYKALALIYNLTAQAPVFNLSSLMSFNLIYVQDNIRSRERFQAGFEFYILFFQWIGMDESRYRHVCDIYSTFNIYKNEVEKHFRINLQSEIFLLMFQERPICLIHIRVPPMAPNYTKCYRKYIDLANIEKDYKNWLKQIDETIFFDALIDCNIPDSMNSSIRRSSFNTVYYQSPPTIRQKLMFEAILREKIFQGFITNDDEIIGELIKYYKDKTLEQILELKNQQINDEKEFNEFAKEYKDGLPEIITKNKNFRENLAKKLDESYFIKKIKYEIEQFDNFDSIVDRIKGYLLSMFKNLY